MSDGPSGRTISKAFMLTLENLRIPKNWEIVAGADTGTYMGGAICAIDPNLELYVLEEFPNYHYTGDGTIELTGETVGEWVYRFATRLRYWTKRKRNFAWVDANTTFKTEIAHGFRFKMNRKDLELRTEITREYLRNGRLHLMPWLSILPYELEEAHWPDHESPRSGKLKRIKDRDHCLDGVEHACSRRPHPKFRLEAPAKRSTLRDFALKHARPNIQRIDPHLGVN